MSDRGWWWLSFADPTLPKEDQFLGVAIVQAPFDIAGAARAAHRLGLNPGGEVAGWRLQPERVPEEKWRNRLLTREEAMESGA